MELHKRNNRENLKEYQKLLKGRLKGFWFWKSKFVLPIGALFNKEYKKPPGAESKGTYKSQEAPKKPSFTKVLRNQNGYAEYLKNKKFNISSC